MKKVIVIGNGYVGSNVACYLSTYYQVILVGPKNEYSNLVKHYDNIRTKYEIISTDTDYNLDNTLVINCLGFVKKIESIADYEMIQTFDKLNMFLILKCNHSQNSKYVYFSSSGEYYLPNMEVKNEESLCNYSNFYSLNKFYNENLVKMYSKDYLICRLSNPYGGINPYKKGIVEMVKKKVAITIFDSLDSTKDYIHVDDIGGQIMSIINEKNETYNICSGLSYTLKEIINPNLENCKIVESSNNAMYSNIDNKKIMKNKYENKYDVIKYLKGMYE